MILPSVRSLLLLSVGIRQVPPAPAPPNEQYNTNAAAAFQTLQQWYNNSTGQYNTTGWWNSANCLTVISDLAAFDPNVKPEVIPVLANSFVAAQNANLQVTKVVQPDFNIKSFYGSSVPAGVHALAASNPQGFLDGFYDDEGWWALAWIQAYDITLDGSYLQTAINIFDDMKNGSTTNCGGGIWWDKAHTYVNAIANELYLSIASHLANRASNKSYYLALAQEQFDWVQKSGLINSNNLINDGLTSSCFNNNGTVWSYNQGVILGALAELNKASPNTTYIAVANNIALEAIASLGSSGVLHDACDATNSCGGDGSQFKGIFMRNLQTLQVVSPNNKYLDFIATNAQSIWASDRNEQNELSVNWAGPFFGPANASTQSSALDALVAAAAFAGDGISS